MRYRISRFLITISVIQHKIEIFIFELKAIVENEKQLTAIMYVFP